MDIIYTAPVSSTQRRVLSSHAFLLLKLKNLAKIDPVPYYQSIPQILNII